MNHEYMKRISDYIKEQNVDAILIAPSIDINFILGYAPGLSGRFEGLFIKADGTKFYVVNKLSIGETERAIGTEMPIYNWFDGDGLTASIKEIFEKEGLCGKKIAVGDTTRAVHVMEMAAATGAEFIEGKTLLENMRIRKSSAELDNLRKAASIADAAFTEAIKFIKVGMTETEVITFLKSEMAKRGGVMTWGSVAAGANASFPHHRTGDTVIKKGDLVLMDYGCVYNGYFSDMTRTVAIEEVSDRAKELYGYVKESNAAGEAHAKVGVTAASVDKAARDVLAKYGYAETLITRVGHGIGFLMHEQPEIKACNDTVLDVGMCFSVEPGIYITNDIGIRIEDIVVLNEKGETEILNKSTKELLILNNGAL